MISFPTRHYPHHAQQNQIPQTKSATKASFLCFYIGSMWKIVNKVLLEYTNTKQSENRLMPTLSNQHLYCPCAARESREFHLWNHRSERRWLLWHFLVMDGKAFCSSIELITSTIGGVQKAFFDLLDGGMSPGDEKSFIGNWVLSTI